MSETDSKNPVLTEGTDYTVEAGRWVFTAEYLRKGGSVVGRGVGIVRMGLAKMD